jgi:hypothetical protein
MGGNVGIIIKKATGEQIAQDRWTNIMPYQFSQVELYDGEPEVWYEGFSKQWEVMKKDYEKNKDTGNFTENMTSVYFPHENACPSEYGLIAVDFGKKKIYSSQDYCGIGTLSIYNMWEDEEDKEEFKKFFEAGLIGDLIFDNFDEKDIRTKYKIDIKDLTWKEMVSLLEEITQANSYRKSDNLDQEDVYQSSALKGIKKDFGHKYQMRFEIKSDWEFFIRHDRSIGILELKKELDKDGFLFTPEDNKAWQKYLKYAYYDEKVENFSKEELENYNKFSTLYKEVFGEDFVIKMEEKKSKIK